MSIDGHVPEKDGILGSMLVAELVAAEGKSLKEIQKEFFAEFGALKSIRADLLVEQGKKNGILEQLKITAPHFWRERGYKGKQDRWS